MIGNNSLADLERRKSIRLRQELPVSFKFLNSNKEFQAFTKDVAKDGVYVNADLPQKDLNKFIFLKLEVPDIQKKLIFHGQVAWLDSRDKEKIQGFGIKFLRPQSNNQECLKDYILKKLNLSIQAPVKPDLSLRDLYADLTEKERRNLNMLDTIRRLGPISKAEIAKIVNLNIGTISNYIEDYLKKDIIFDKGLDISSGGRRPSLLELNQNFAYTIGIDIQEYIYACLIDARGSIVNKLKQEVKNYIEELPSLISELIITSKINTSLIKGIGFTKNYKLASSSELVSLLEKKFNLPIFTVGFSNSCVFAEYWMSLDSVNSKSIVYLSLADFSCGLILNKEPYYLRDKANKPAGLDMINIVDMLYLKILNIVDLLGPDLIILGCPKVVDLNETMNYLKDKIKDSKDNFGSTKIVVSNLGEYGASLGVASLVMREVFIQS